MLLLGKPGLIFFQDSINYKHGGNLKETWNVINSSLGRKPKMTVTNEVNATIREARTNFF